MEPEASLPWLALTMTPGIAARLSARLLKEFGTPEGVFRASLTSLEACNLRAPVAQAIFKKQIFWRAEKEDWLPCAALARAGIPAGASPDLRPAGGAVCSRRRQHPKRPEPEHRWYTPADGVRHADGRTHG